MSRKRMFSPLIVQNDEFLDMPLTSQALYFHLCMGADDDGFVTPKKVMRMVGAGADDLKILIIKRYILAFDSGVIVIKHWLNNNTIRKDRYTATTYEHELKSLTTNEFGAYTELSKLNHVVSEIANVVTKLEGGVEEYTTEMNESEVLDNDLATTGKPNGNQLATQVRLDKVRLDKYILVDSQGCEYHVDVKELLGLLIKKLGFSESVKLTEGRIAKLKNRLKVFSATEMVKAAINLADDAYMQGENESGKRYGTIDYLLRTDEIVDKYCNEVVAGKIDITKALENL